MKKIDGDSSLGEGIGCGVLIFCIAAAVALVMWAGQGFPGFAR